MFNAVKLVVAGAVLATGLAGDAKPVKAEQPTPPPVTIGPVKPVESTLAVKMVSGESIDRLDVQQEGDEGYDFLKKVESMVSGQENVGTVTIYGLGGGGEDGKQKMLALVPIDSDPNFYYEEGGDDEISKLTILDAKNGEVHLVKDAGEEIGKDASFKKNDKKSVIRFKFESGLQYKLGGGDSAYNGGDKNNWSSVIDFSLAEVLLPRLGILGGVGENG